MLDERGKSDQREDASSSEQPPKKLYAEARKNLKTMPKAPVTTGVQETSSSALPVVKGKRGKPSGTFSLLGSCISKV